MLGSKKSTKKRSKNGGGEPNGEGACGEQGVSLRETGGFITTFHEFHYDFLGDRLVAIWRYSSTSDFSFLMSAVENFLEFTRKISAYYNKEIDSAFFI